MARGVPRSPRTDSLSAAFNNLAEREEPTARYEALCKHCGMRPTQQHRREPRERRRRGAPGQP